MSSQDNNPPETPDPDRTPLLPPLVPEIPESRDLRKLERAASAVLHTGLSSADAAERLGVDADDLHRMLRARRERSGTENLPAPRAADPELHPGQAAASWRGRKSKLKLVEKPEIDNTESWDSTDAAPTEGAPNPLLRISVLRWLFGTRLRLAITAGLAIVGMVSAITILARRAGAPPPQAELLVPEPEKPSITESEFDSAEALAHRYLQADGWERKQAFVFQPEQIAPLAGEWYARLGNKGSDAGMTTPETVNAFGMIRDDRRYVVVEATSGGAQALAVVELPPVGEPRIDWRSSVGYTARVWSEFSSERDQRETDFLVRCSRSDYFNDPFRDDSHYAFRLDPPGSEDGGALFGYVRKDDPLAEYLMRLTHIRGRPRNLILKIRFPQSGFRDCVEIVDCVAEGWIQPPL